MGRLTGWCWVGGLAAWVTGVVAQLQQVSLLHASFYGLICLLSISLIALGALFLASFRRRQVGGAWGTGAAVLCWLVAVAALGWSSTGWRAAEWASRALPDELEGRTLLLTGRVVNLPTATPLGWRLAFEPDSAALWADGGSAAGDQTVQPPPRVLLSWVDQPGVAAPRSGERWQLAVRLRKPHGLANPHGFDSELWLWSQGVAATGYVRMGRKDPAPRRLAEAGWGLHPLREAVRDQVVRTVVAHRTASDRLLLGTNAETIETDAKAARLAGVLTALVVGDQASIDRQDWDVFRTTGVAHLMAISGLHITLWAWLVALVVRLVWGRLPVWAPGWGSRVLLACPAPVAAAWGGCLLALAYAVFSGWGVPAQRTVLMLAVVVALRTSGRHWPWPLTMALALAVVLAWEPWAWLQAGFWLSFVAVGVLLAQSDAPHQGSTVLVRHRPILAHGKGALSRLRAASSTLASAEWLKRLKYEAALLGSTQWVMTLSLAPLTLLLFGQVSVVGFLANLVAIPVVTLVVTPLALAGVVWPGFWLASAEVLSWCMRGLVWLAEWPWASLAWPAVPWGWGVLAVCGGVVLAMPWPVRVRLAGAACLLPALLWTPPRPLAGEFELLAADVGQGSAVLIRTASGSVLYDAGPQWSLHADAGQRVLRPLLQALGERPSHVVLSHRDGDHVGGALGVLQGLPQAQVWASLPPSQLVSRLSAPDLVAEVMGDPRAVESGTLPAPTPLSGAQPDGNLANPWPTRLGDRAWTRCEAGQAWVMDGVRF